MKFGFTDTLKVFYRYCRPYRRQFALGILSLLGVDLLSTIPPLLLKEFIDRVAALTPATRAYAPFFYIGLAYCTFAIGQGLCRYLWRVFLLPASFRSAERVRMDYFAKLQRLPPEFYNKNTIGDLMSLATNDIEAVRFALGPGLLVFFDAVFQFLALPPAMLWLSPKLTALSLAPVLLLPLVIIKTERLVHDRFEKVQAQFSKLSGFAQENIEGIQVLKAFVREWTQLKRFSAIGKKFVRLNLKLTAAQSIFEPAFLLTVTLGISLLVAFAGRDVITGAIGLGTFIAFTRYLEQLAWPMMGLGMAVNYYQRGKTSIERIVEVLSEKEPTQPTALIQPGVVYNETATPVPMLEARGLTFYYPGSQEPALVNVNFRIRAGQKTALVGPVGSGKTTLVRLLTGLYEISPGMLFWNGIDVTQLSLTQRRDQLSLVPQDPFLFSGPLQWNVDLGDSKKLVRESLERAGLADETKLWGLQARISERGANLSGGQRARVALARALARATPSRLLVLDDALSSVDAETEARIFDKLDGNLLMITHRFTKLWKFDQVLVLNEGTLLQNGDPTELAAAPGLYRDLLELQQMESELTRI